MCCMDNSNIPQLPRLCTTYTSINLDDQKQNQTEPIINIDRTGQCEEDSAHCAVAHQ